MDNRTPLSHPTRKGERICGKSVRFYTEMHMKKRSETVNFSVSNYARFGVVAPATSGGCAPSTFSGGRVASGVSSPLPRPQIWGSVLHGKDAPRLASPKEGGVSYKCV